MNSPNFRLRSNLLSHALPTNFSRHMTKDEILVADIGRIEYFLSMWHLVGSQKRRLKFLMDSQISQAVILFIDLIHIRCVLSRHYDIELKILNYL